MAVIRYPSLTAFSNPFREIARMQREMDRLLTRVVGSEPSLVSSGVFPALNVSEEGDKLLVQAELPGVKSEDLEISVEGNTLTLRGKRKTDNPENVSYHRRERGVGTFQKAVTLPFEINSEAVEASCRDGVLRLVLPKAERAKPKKITVKAGV